MLTMFPHIVIYVYVELDVAIQYYQENVFIKEHSFKELY